MGVWSRYMSDQAQSRLSGKIDLPSLAIDALLGQFLVNHQAG